MTAMGTSFGVTENIEKKLYDLRLRTLPETIASDDIRLVAIDAPSIEAIGRWPWPRGVMADLLSRIAAGEPKALGCAVIFSEPDDNPGLMALKDLKEEYQSVLETESESFAPLLERLRKDGRYKKVVATHPFGDLRGFGQTIDETARDLDNDARFKSVLAKAKRLVFAFYFRSLGSSGDDSSEHIDRLKNAGFLQSQVEGSLESIPEGSAPLLPLADVSKRSEGLGHVTVIQDADGAVRREAPVMHCRGQVVPSLALQMARVAMNLKMSDVRVRPGKEIVLGKKVIPLDEESKLLIRYSGDFASIKKDSAVDVLRDSGGIPSKTFKNKLVLVGITDTALGSSFVTPVDPSFQYNGVVLSVLRNIWEGTHLSRPPWARQVEFAWLGMVGLFVTFGLPLLKAKRALAVTAGLLVVTLGAGWYWFVAQNGWIKIFYPVAVLVAAYAVVTVRRFFFTEMRKDWVEAQSIETNKSLGLSYQTQGLLDMAFEKLRKCPVDDDMKGVLYNLALDFERKRQFGKAGVVYDHIALSDPNYKDVKDRSRSAKQAGETGALGSAGKAGGTVVMGAGAAKPTLGRYEIEKELGRGAMGVVYLGRDPKINRSVAIKTLRFEDDNDAETAKMVRDRFFREAESAGTLNHPHIIRIFDAGEDGDISYIAMELLEGEDLKKYAEKANLLPVPVVVDYVATIAEALDYAHAHGVVHRDIKPANIMRLKDGSLRVTDFGIARIAASSKTATGTVMGTPSYMSPEQLSGKKIDGRSDLFSLGVMLYELLTGEKPFEGESIATLLFKIASEEAPDVLRLRPDRVSPSLKAVIDRALLKDPDQRYQRGADMARDLRAIGGGGGGAAPVLETPRLTAEPSNSEKVTAQVPHPPLRGSRVPVAHLSDGPNRPRAQRAFPQEGKENNDFPSPLGRGQGEGPEL
ncbi:MAG: CHASE2 domain-containing protein, partial [Elusimicrobia bacterium]|nr:CHASE2 domain-containing protein [Elusimicrobiota bacterium]